MTRRWRRGRQVPHLPGEPTDPVPVGDALAEVGAELGLGSPEAIGVLVARWREVVGPALAEHARVRALRGTTLTVAVESGLWATELRHFEADALARISSMIGAGVVEHLRVVVEPGPATPR